MDSSPKANSRRTFIFSWGIFSVITATFFSANLVAIFAVQKPKIPFKSLGEMVRQNEYKWGFVNGTIKEHIFKRSNAGDMKLAWDGVIEFNKTDPSVLSENVSDLIVKMKTEKYALIHNRFTVTNARGHDCNIRTVGQNIIMNQIGIGAPSNYPIKRELEDVLSVIADSGLLELWWRRWGSRTDDCYHDETVEPLTLQDVSSAFYILIVGLGAAGIVLVVEYINHKLYP